MIPIENETSTENPRRHDSLQALTELVSCAQILARFKENGYPADIALKLSLDNLFTRHTLRGRGARRGVRVHTRAHLL